MLLTRTAFCAEMTKVQRKKHDKKMAAVAATMPKVIPLHEQAIDITPTTKTTAGGNDTIAAANDNATQQQEIRRSARNARRKGIREANFLHGL